MYKYTYILFSLTDFFQERARKKDSKNLILNNISGILINRTNIKKTVQKSYSPLYTVQFVLFIIGVGVITTFYSVSENNISE